MKNSKAAFFPAHIYIVDMHDALLLKSAAEVLELSSKVLATALIYLHKFQHKAREITDEKCKVTERIKFHAAMCPGPFAQALPVPLLVFKTSFYKCACGNRDLVGECLEFLSLCMN